MTLRIPAKVLLHVWSYDFYDMTLSTGKQRRHMIIHIIIYLLQNMFFLHMRYRQELRSRIAAQYLESRIRSKIDKTHITLLGEKAVSPNDWLTYPRDPYHP